ncbi:hypothetical protein AGMMS49957_10080 [Synergistales bacterium]|nr:hypothetical protein AGMMS49957_10080 [Synergistales bacterium]
MKTNILKGKRGFTLLEILVVIVVSAIIFGAAIMLVGSGSQLAAVNNAYSMAQRAALATVEFLPKDISVATQVEIISRDWAHDIAKGVSDDWQYIVLNSKDNRVVHISKYDGTKTLPGSELITSLSFDAGGNKNDNDIRKLVYVKVTARTAPDGNKTPDYDRTVSLDRSILTHATRGVMGEDNAPISGDVWFRDGKGGSILRYRIDPDNDPKIDLYWSKGTMGISPGAFDYSKSDTWKSLENPNTTTHINAKLTLPRRLKQDTVVFSWIAVDQNILENNITTEKNSTALLTFLKGDGTTANPGHLSSSDWGHIQDRLDDEFTVADIELGTANASGDSTDSRISFVGDSGFADDPLYITNPPTPNSRGVRLLKMTSGKLSNETNEGDEYNLFHPFNLGEIVGILMTNGNDYYHGSYMIVMAHYKEGGAWKDWPVYVRMGDEQSDSIFKEIVNALATLPKGAAGKVGNIYVNADNNSATLEVADRNANSGNGMFKVSGGSGANPGKVILEFAPENFKHMIPKNNGAPVEPVMYGDTNYAVYLDATSGADGGYGVFLNGSAVYTGTQNNSPYYTSSGYVFQFDPGARGLIMRYYYYNGNALGELGDHYFGVVPMYFYDASKGTTDLTTAAPKAFAAPGEIAFFSGDVKISEDFNLSVGADKGASVYYRIPFRPQNTSYYTNIARFPRLRDVGERITGNVNNNWGFYGASGYNNAQYMATYTPKLMQSWHNFKNTTLSGVPKTNATLVNGEYKDAYNNDNLLDNNNIHGRHGYRWDYDWGMNTDAQSMWRRRQILKFTVLEVTKDIKQNDIGYDEINGVKYYWQDPIVIKNTTYDGANNAANPTVHKAGDLFVRVEMIQLRKNPSKLIDPEPNNSRNYVYSKPIWFGKIKGDAWRGDDNSPFKKMGDTTAHIVSAMEPRAGDAQSFRRRGMRVRSWKEAIYGQDFSGTTGSTEANLNTGAVSYRRGRNSATPTPFAEDWTPDYPKLGYIGSTDVIWTPPIAIDLNARNADDSNFTTGANPSKNITQPGNANTNTAYVGANANNAFGQYSYGGNQYIQRQMKGPAGAPQYAYNDYYTNQMYGRLSMLRPYADRAKPLYGLYAMRGWDFGYNDNTNAVFDSAASSSKRFLMVVRGQRMPYNLHTFTSDAGDTTINNAYYNREATNSNATNDPNGTHDAVGKYNADRVRTMAFRFWSGGGSAKPTLYYDDWIGEGFNAWEVREILGLDPAKYPVFIRDADADDTEKNQDGTNKNRIYEEADFDNWREIRKFYIQGNNDATTTGMVDAPTTIGGVIDETVLTSLQKKGYYTRPVVDEE